MLKKFKNNNKGSGWALIRVSCYMLILLVFTAAVDAVVLLASMATLSYNTMYVSKQLSVNGGLPGGIKNQTVVVEPLKRAAHLCGIDDNDWSVIVKSDGLKDGEANVYPGGSLEKDSDTDPVNSISDLGISKGHNKIQTLELTFVHKWKFCPIFRMLNLETPITISYNYRSEYIRPIKE